MTVKKQLVKSLRKHPGISRIAINILYVFLYPRYSEEIEKSISDFSRSRNMTDSKKLRRDMLYSMIIDRVAAAEYFLFEFEEKNRAGRKKYIGYLERRAIVAEITDEKGKQLLTDKEKCYEKYADFYGRDLLKVDRGKEEEFKDFIIRHPHFIVKPLDQSLGIGIYTCEYHGNPDEEERLYQEIEKNGTSVAEELICQSKELGKFHPDSVNTVRVVTYAENPDNPTVLFSVFRMGIGGSVMDNASSGGILAGIDCSTGIVETKGYRENGEIYLSHPDTNEQIIGFNIPHWEEMLDMIRRLVKRTPEVKLVGWDLALTKKGWVLVEANYRPSFRGIQMCTHTGIRSRVEEVIGKTDV